MSADKTLICRDCGTSFAFTASEQDFYLEKGFMNEPGRCPECRAASKARRNVSSGGYANAGGYDRPPRQMYPAVCSSCGKATEVPFEPRLDKPVYCRDCYTPRERSGAGSYGSRGGSSYGGRNGGSRRY